MGNSLNLIFLAILWIAKIFFITEVCLLYFIKMCMKQNCVYTIYYLIKIQGSAMGPHGTRARGPPTEPSHEMRTRARQERHKGSTVPGVLTLWSRRVSGVSAVGSSCSTLDLALPSQQLLGFMHIRELNLQSYWLRSKVFLLLKYGIFSELQDYLYHDNPGDTLSPWSKHSPYRPFLSCQPLPSLSFWLLLQGHLRKWWRQVSEGPNPGQWPDTAHAQSSHTQESGTPCHSAVTNLSHAFPVVSSSDDKISTYLKGLLKPHELGNW